MLDRFLFRQILNTNDPSLLKGLILQRALILLIASAAFTVNQFAGIQPFLEPGFTTVLVITAILLVLQIMRSRQNKQINQADLFMHLLVDAFMVLLFIHFSGGTANPFIYYLLVFVAISAVILPKGHTWIFTLLAIFSYTALFTFEMSAHKEHAFSGFQLHLLGMWINFVASALLIAFFLSTLSQALKEGQLQLSKAREQNLRNEQLVGIGTLAASTVHALRTPLSTMAVLLSDLKSDQQNQAIASDIDLLLAQVERCKVTTDKLASLADSPEGNSDSISVKELVTELEQHYQLTLMSGKNIRFAINAIEQHQVAKHILLFQALLNLIDNALHAARGNVQVTFVEESGHLVIFIDDDGEGLPETIKQKWGQPFFSQKADGLGIGTFLANSTIERFEGSIELLSAAGSNPAFTTRIKVTLPFHEQAKAKGLAT